MKPSKYRQNNMNRSLQREIELNWLQVDIDNRLSQLEQRIGELTLVAENLLFDAEDANYRRKLLNYVLNR